MLIAIISQLVFFNVGKVIVSDKNIVKLYADYSIHNNL